MARKKPLATSSKPRNQKKRQGNLIFSLDIGTRTVVGIVGKMEEDTFHVIEHYVVPHPKRAMIDGQIEDIEEVAKTVKKVKEALEEKLNVTFSHVAIAAAGRALKTKRAVIDIEIPTKEPLSEELCKSYEFEAVAKAQAEIDKENAESDDEFLAQTSFYCVGHSVISYSLDNYPMKSIVGHRGKKLTIEVIAAFLPGMVVESLYTVMEKNKLKVSSLTLEPIAAMNVIIPPEVRLINIALVDIGAGTSDIAISKDGSIVAYAMATFAGDEITEEIIKRFLVDFNTAEEMKLNAHGGNITYKDILGFEHNITAEEFYSGIYTSIDALADTIAQNIVDVNKQVPAAIFLVGGGSLIPELPQIIAKKLDIPETRVAVGGSNFIKAVTVLDKALTSPDFVTPIGIGVTSILQKGYDFSTIFLNDKQFRLFDTKNLTVFDILLMGGYKAKQILGRTGKNLSFTINGKQVIERGTLAEPATITLNGNITAINEHIKQWDKVHIIPAKDGYTPQIKLSEIVGNFSKKQLTFNDVKCFFGTTVSINGEITYEDYQIKNGDNIEITHISTLKELLKALNISSELTAFFKADEQIGMDYQLANDDVITTKKITEIKQTPPPQNIQPKKVEPKTENINVSPTKSDILPKKSPSFIEISVNGKIHKLENKADGSSHLFLEALNLSNLDLEHPTGPLIMTINGQSAQYTSELKDKDDIKLYFQN